MTGIYGMDIFIQEMLYKNAPCTAHTKKAVEKFHRQLFQISIFELEAIGKNQLAFPCILFLERRITAAGFFPCVIIHEVGNIAQFKVDIEIFIHFVVVDEVEFKQSIIGCEVRTSIAAPTVIP